MKINQVAELTGLTKKNIRFYEEQGLVDPDRDPGNGYREYSLADVEQLKRVKLLRQLGVSCENIRRVKEGSLALDQCLRDRQRELEAESHDLEQMKEMCRLMEGDVDELSAVDASTYLEKMAELEKGGVRFMTVK
ncbi:MAG: MerR family transcriptional regulator, partial [Firmicutes bacterium]|nr:MerR family transcriptional regulator [Bacillota bacterium]